MNSAPDTTAWRARRVRYRPALPRWASQYSLAEASRWPCRTSAAMLATLTRPDVTAEQVAALPRDEKSGGV
jgi:hypothetical protein